MTFGEKAAKDEGRLLRCERCRQRGYKTTTGECLRCRTARTTRLTTELLPKLEG